MKITPVPQGTTPMAGMPVAAHPAREPRTTIRMQTNATQETAAPPPPAAAQAAQATRDQGEAASDAVRAPISPERAALARERRALQVKERELKQKEEAFAAKSAGTDQADILARLKAEPLSVLLENGVTYDQLTQAILAQQGDSKVAALKAEIDALKDGLDQKLKDRDLDARKQVVAEMRREAQGLAAGEEFELVRESGSVPKVIELIERTYDKTGEVLDVREAMQLMEDQLLEDTIKLAKIQKLQGKLVPAPMQRDVRASAPQGMRSLSNRDVATQPMSRKQRALARFWNQPVA